MCTTSAGEVSIRPARPDDASRLREIVHRSKGHWGYDEAQLGPWVARFDFDELFRTHEVTVAEADGRIVAWASLIPPDEGVALLDDLWVEPAWIGHRIGSRLFALMRDRAAALGAVHNS